MRLLHWIRARWARLFPRRSLGQRGEALACRHLKRLGYVIVARGDRDRTGEIDLIAVDGGTVVFVEVKTRRSHEKGSPVDAVDHKKQRRLTRLALGFLKRHDLLESPARFDVVAITWPSDSQPPRVEHFPNAFESTERWQMFG
jgi:putative endonuclease